MTAKFKIFRDFPQRRRDAVVFEMAPDTVEYAALIGGEVAEIVHTYKCTYFETAAQVPPEDLLSHRLRPIKICPHLVALAQFLDVQIETVARRAAGGADGRQDRKSRGRRGRSERLRLGRVHA